MSEETKQPSTGDDAKKTPAAKKPAARKTAAKTPAAKKTATKKAAPKKTAATTAKKPAATKSAAAKRATTAKKTSPATAASSKPAAKPASPAEDVTTDKIEAESKGTEEAAAQTHGKNHESFNEEASDPYSAEKLAADFKEKDWKEVFIRAAFTVFYMFAGWIAIALGGTFTLIQFIIHLVTGHPNDVVKKAILSVGQYIGDIAAYVSFARDERPFPFGKDLPNGE